MIMVFIGIVSDILFSKSLITEIKCAILILHLSLLLSDVYSSQKNMSRISMAGPLLIQIITQSEKEVEFNLIGRQ